MICRELSAVAEELEKKGIIPGNQKCYTETYEQDEISDVIQALELVAENWVLPFKKGWRRRQTVGLVWRAELEREKGMNGFGMMERFAVD